MKHNVAFCRLGSPTSIEIVQFSLKTSFVCHTNRKLLKLGFVSFNIVVETLHNALVSDNDDFRLPRLALPCKQRVAQHVAWLHKYCNTLNKSQQCFPQEKVLYLQMLNCCTLLCKNITCMYTVQYIQQDFQFDNNLTVSKI